MKKGFTLVELLVVVLIIGILSAIALPQYQKSVYKARATEMQMMVRALNTAQEAYYLANGEYADSFDKLDIRFDVLTSAPALATAYGWNDCRTKGDQYAIMINNGFSMAGFLSGPYMGGGFAMRDPFDNSDDERKSGVLYCFDTNGNFCQQFYASTVVKKFSDGTWYSFL